ncbi:MAG: hemolysin family protein [Treponema sp.]|jgi:putative hemolysin|nr:hemolysin family protein [Treponema sp.]
MEDPWLNSGIAGAEYISSRILFILAVILIKAFFTLAETAFTCSRKTYLRTLAENGNRKYRQVLETAENPPVFLAGLRIWIIFLEILAGAAGGFGPARYLSASLKNIESIAPYAGILGPAAITLCITAAAVLLGDMLPKMIALSAPEKISAAVLPLVKVLAAILRPFSLLSLRLKTLIRNAFGLDEKTSAVTEEELRVALREGEKSGVVESRERDMVEGVFYLGDRPVRAFMTHRSEIDWIEINAGVEEIRSLALKKNNQNCFPVAKEALDEIVGMVFREDILKALLSGFSGGLRSILKQPQFVPETMSALKAFEAFKKGETDHLFVMDEYSGFAGILPVQGLVEEIIGQLSAEAGEGEELNREKDGSFTASGSISIDDIAQALSLESLNSSNQGPNPEYHTLAGFILSLTGEVPKTNDIFEYGSYTFRILSMDGNRIEKVLIIPSAGTAR